jgi:hypothetical protein
MLGMVIAPAAASTAWPATLGRLGMRGRPRSTVEDVACPLQAPSGGLRGANERLEQAHVAGEFPDPPAGLAIALQEAPDASDDGIVALATDVDAPLPAMALIILRQ